jgi:hypothetical protein
MSQTYDVTMTEDQRKTLLLVVDETGAEGGLKGARRQARAATALETFRLKRPVAVDPGERISISNSAPVVVRLTHENVEVILESADRACKPVMANGPNGPVQIKPALLVVRGMKIIDGVVGTLEAITNGETVDLEGVEVVGLNGSGKGEGSTQEPSDAA